MKKTRLFAVALAAVLTASVATMMPTTVSAVDVATATESNESLTDEQIQEILDQMLALENQLLDKWNESEENNEAAWEKVLEALDNLSEEEYYSQFDENGVVTPDFINTVTTLTDAERDALIADTTEIMTLWDQIYALADLLPDDFWDAELEDDVVGTVSDETEVTATYGDLVVATAVATAPTSASASASNATASSPKTGNTPVAGFAATGILAMVGAVCVARRKRK